MKQLLIALFILILFSGVADAGNITLTVEPPTHNTDNSLLTDLAGYKIYYGNASGEYSISVVFGTEPIFYIPDLVGGQIYYFAAVAFNTAEIESAFSNEYFEVIPFEVPECPTNLRRL